MIGAPTVVVVDVVVFVIETSGEATFVTAVDELFAVFGSVVVVAIVAVFEVEPGEPATVCTLSVKVVDAPDASVAAVQVTVPFVPAVGVVQLKTAPAWFRLTNVSFAGNASVTVTFAASLGPAFEATIV